MKHPNEHFESEGEYFNYLEETEQQLDPDQSWQARLLDEPEDLEVTENYPFAPEPW